MKTVTRFIPLAYFKRACVAGSFDTNWSPETCTCPGCEANRLEFANTCLLGQLFDAQKELEALREELGR